MAMAQDLFQQCSGRVFADVTHDELVAELSQSIVERKQQDTSEKSLPSLQPMDGSIIRHRHDDGTRSKTTNSAASSFALSSCSRRSNSHGYHDPYNDNEPMGLVVLDKIELEEISCFDTRHQYTAPPLEYIYIINMTKKPTKGLSCEVDGE